VRRSFATIELHVNEWLVEEEVPVPQAPAPTGVCDAASEEPPSGGVIAIAGEARVKRVTTVEGVIAIAGEARVTRVTTVGWRPR
jgi:hypothetical protein